MVEKWQHFAIVESTRQQWLTSFENDFVSWSRVRIAPRRATVHPSIRS